MKVDPPAESTSEIYYQPRSSKDEIISAKEKSSGALNLMTNLISTKETTDPETLIDIKISNPLKRIYELIQEIKRHQSTTFSLKFTIPLIALPIFLFAAFQLGRGQTLCRQITTSKIGVITNISVDVPKGPTNKIPLIGSLSRLLGWTQSTSKYETEKRAVLLDSKGDTVTVLYPEKIDMQNYDNSSVIVTGLYSSCTNVITVVSERNISTF